MKLSNLIFTKILFISFLSLGINYAWAQAPNSLVGKRIQITFDGESTPLGYLYITSANEEWWWDGEDTNGDGGWQRANYQMSKTNSSTINYQGGDLDFGYGEVNFVFSTSSSGTFQYIGDWELKDGNWVLDTEDQSTGTFLMETFLETDFPFEEYFSDDFSDISESNSIWHRGHGFSMDGVVLSQNNGVLTLSGQYTGDPDDRWFQSKPRSLLPTNKDWTVSGATFNTSTSDYSKRATSLIAIHSAVDPSFVLAIGNHVQSSNWHWWYERGWQSSGNSVNQNTSGEFRIYNDSANKNFVVEWNDAGAWIKALTFNWDTGSYTSSDGSSGLVNDWISLEGEYIQPMIEFGELMNEGEESSLTFGVIPENSLGVSSFSVSEGMPEIAINYVPDSFQNLKLTVHWETESGESGTNLNYVIDEDTVKIHHLYGTSDAFWAEESFTWIESGHNTMSSTTTNEDGRVVTGILIFQDADSGTFELKFYEPENGQLVYQESGSGTFTIEEYSPAELPSTKGWMWFDHYPWVYSEIEQGWIYFYSSGSKLMAFSVKDQVWRVME